MHHRASCCHWPGSSTLVNLEVKAPCFPGTAQGGWVPLTRGWVPAIAQRGSVVDGSFRPSSYPLAKAETAPAGGSRPGNTPWAGGWGGVSSIRGAMENWVGGASMGTRGTLVGTWGNGKH